MAFALIVMAAGPSTYATTSEVLERPDLFDKRISVGGNNLER